MHFFSIVFGHHLLDVAHKLPKSIETTHTYGGPHPFTDLPMSRLKVEEGSEKFCTLETVPLCWWVCGPGRHGSGLGGMLVVAWLWTWRDAGGLCGMLLVVDAISYLASKAPATGSHPPRLYKLALPRPFDTIS